MAAPGAFYITTAISYVNGPPHLGHAYEAIATDVLARFKRLDGFEVKFLTGTDEHGEKVATTAAKAGKTAREFADSIARLFREMGALLDISNDDFIRTTEARHYRASQAIWQALVNAEEIYLDKYAGWYSVRDEAYFAEEELTRRSDGSFCAPSGAEVEWVEEPSYFFRLSRWGDRLLKLYDEVPNFIQPATRRNEIVSFVKRGLRDLSVSRTSFDWGVPVPGDPKHVMYVWLDALTNYLTAAGYPDVGSESFRRFWPADVHMIGKDIVRFHTIYWPAFLMAAGLPLPKRVFGHGFLNVEGQKMSKSIGNVLSPQALVATYGLDQIRYFLMREVPFGGDGSFSHESIVQRINSDLANDLGNLAQRVLSFVNKNCSATMPTPGSATDADRALLAAAAALLPQARAAIERDLAFHNVLNEIWRVIGDANRYIDAQAPWTLRKTDPPRMATALYVSADALRRIVILLQPFMPRSCTRLLDQLAVPLAARTFAAMETALVPGTVLPKPEGVFPRYVEAAA